MQRIAYGLVTQSIEDPDQLILLDGDVRYSELDSEQIMSLPVSGQPLVGLEDVLAAVRDALVSVDCSSVDAVVSEVRQEMLARRRG